jgi:hypothetical protein
LEAALQRPDGAAHARGLQRGFEGKQAVSEDEHRRLTADRDSAVAYRNGLLQGMNLRLLSTMYGPPEDDEVITVSSAAASNL